jgi:hypothetical protein
MPDLKLPPPVNDGGHAFPQPLELIGRGMSLRDFFAAAALQGFLASGLTASVVAVDAYRMADAMLATREKS